MVSSAETWCGGASSRRDPSSMPAGKASQTGYQYDSISRVAGQRELAPPSNLSNEGGFRNRVFKGMSIPLVQWKNLSHVHKVGWCAPPCGMKTCAAHRKSIEDAPRMFTRS